MLRFDRLTQWADTTMAAPASEHPWPPRRAFIPQGCDQQGRLQPTIPMKAEPAADGAHASSELLEEPDTHDNSGGIIVWGLAMLVAVAAGAAVGALVWGG